MTRPFGKLVILLVALLLGGCGGATTKVDPAVDLALAKTAVLTAADLPGYSEKPYQESSDFPDSVKNDFAKCLNVDATFFDDIPGAQSVHSSDFEKDRASISSSIEIDPRRSDIDHGWDQFTRAGIEPCLQRLFDAGLKLVAPSGAAFGATTVTRFQRRSGRPLGRLRVHDPGVGPG